MSGSNITALERIWRRLQMAIGIGRIQASNDSGLVQMVQVQFNAQDVRDNTPRVSEYGYASNPRPGAHAIFICVAGDRSNGVIIGTNDESARMKNLQVGEVAIYDDLGQSVYLTRTGIVVNGAGMPITVDGSTIFNGSMTVNGVFHATGAVSSDASVTAPLVSGTTDVKMAGKSGVAHTHGGVQPGTGNSGGPN